MPVLGMLHQNGKLEVLVIKKLDGKTIKPLLFNRIHKDATIITDGFGAYSRIGNHFSKHVVINHAENQFAVGEYNTNSIEGFWSLVKRLMKISKNWRDFMEKFNELYGQKSLQFEDKPVITELDEKLKRALEYDPKGKGEN